MALCASFEATLRTDYLVRAERRRLKDPASRKLRALFKKKGQRASLEEILDVWKDVFGSSAALAEFKQMVKYRDWLAHGRYWHQKSGLVVATVDELYSRGEAVLRATELLPVS